MAISKPENKWVDENKGCTSSRQWGCCDVDAGGAFFLYNDNDDQKLRRVVRYTLLLNIQDRKCEQLRYNQHQ